MLGLLVVTGPVPVAAATSSSTSSRKAIERLTGDAVASRPDGGLTMDRKAASCFATRVVTALGADRALFLGHDPQSSGTAPKLKARERDVYFKAIVACVRDLDRQVAALLGATRADLSPAQLQCATMAYRTNGGLQESLLGDGSPANNQRIAAALAAASKACRITPVILLG